MSYFNGITDAELREEGWTDVQIAELRRVEVAHEARQKREADEAYQKNMADLDEKGAEMYARAVSIGVPPHVAAWAAAGESRNRPLREAQQKAARAAEEQRIATARALRRLNRKWWQFWIR